MRKSISALALLVLSAVVLAGCGGGSMSLQPTSGTVPMSLTIRDNPPMGITVLTFEIQVTGASLQPSNSNSQAVSLLAKPSEVELEHLQTDSALLANLNVPAGAYNGITVTFANPQMTVLNQTGATIMVGGQSCANMQVCEVKPSLNAASASIQAPTPPFPLTLGTNSPVVLQMDFNVNASIQMNDLSITPAISVSQIAAPMGGQHEEMHVVGQITGVDQMAQTFTLQDALTGNTSTFTISGDTEFDFEDSCAADNFSCLSKGQVVKVEAGQMQDGSLVATDVELFADLNQITLEGTVTTINSTSNSFQIVVGQEESFGQGEMQNISTGMPLTVNLAPQATFSIDANGETLPAGLNFASVADMMIGQAVRVHPSSLMLTGAPPNMAITVDTVRLEASQVTASVTAINANANPPTFVLGNLPPLFVSSGVSTLQVDVSPATQFEDLSGLSGLNNGDFVSVAGLLFNTTGSPTVVAEQVFKRGMD